MYVESFITGKRAVSLPFSDYCQPLISEDISFNELFNEVLKLVKSKGLKYLELRGGTKYFPDVGPSKLCWRSLIWSQVPDPQPNQPANGRQSSGHK